MRGKIIVVGSVTYAMKGKDLLFRAGIKSYVERTKRTKEYGCGYSIVIPQNVDIAEQILRANGVKILAVIDP